MKVKCGTDIIEVSRIRECIEDLGDKFLNRVYTEKEIEYCNGKKNVKYEHFAARFAAKEAIFKAVSDLLNDKYEISWKNLEVVNDKNGRPQVNFIGKSFDEIISIDLSLSHLKEYAVASCTVLIK